MMHEINITLINDSGDTLTLVRLSPSRNTPAAHELCRIAEAYANTPDSVHRRYGPWKILSHVWQS